MFSSIHHSRVDGITHFDCTLTENETESMDWIKAILNHLKPSWDMDSIHRVSFGEGTSNQMFAYQQNTSTDSATADVVIFRIYGKNTERFIDRKQELRNHLELWTNQLAPRVYCTFENGYCYEFISGRPINPHDLKDETILLTTARLVARMHVIKPSTSYMKEYGMEGNAFETIKKYLHVLPEKFESDDKEKQFKELGVSLSQIRREVEEITEILLKIPDKEFGFCHNDLNCPNLIFKSWTGTLHCIDYEYASPNYIAYDIGNFFNEFPGNTNIDFNLYPSQEVQLRWLKCYLEEKKKLKGEFSNAVNDEAVKTLYLQANKFALVSHLLWGVWALLQEHFSNLDTSFLSYSIIRFREYFKRKDEFLSLDVRNVKFSHS